jgi:hypothetical protein
LRTKIISIRGVKKLISFTPEYDRRQRLYRVFFVADTDAGTLESAWENTEGGTN